MPDKYGVLLVGGAMTHQEGYAVAFQQDARCRIVGVSDEVGVTPRRAALNRQMAEDFKVPLFDDLDAAMRRPEVHLASICVESERMGRVALRCAAANKHLYLDKPVCADVAEGRLLEAAIEKSGVKAQMFTHWSSVSSQRAMEWVTSGRLGELKAVHFDLTFAKAKTGLAKLGTPRKENPAPKDFLVEDAKREVFNIAVYCLALIRRLAGRRAFESVYASTANYFLAEHQRRDMEDFGSMVVRLAGGVTASIAAGRTGWTSHVAPGFHQIRLVGTRGQQMVDLYAAHGDVFSDRAPWTLPQFRAEDPIGFWASTDQKKSGSAAWFLPATPVPSDQTLFLDCIERNLEPAIGIGDAIRVTEAMMGAYHSAATGRVVKLGLG